MCVVLFGKPMALRGKREVEQNGETVKIHSTPSYSSKNSLRLIKTFWHLLCVQVKILIICLGTSATVF